MNVTGKEKQRLKVKGIEDFPRKWNQNANMTSRDQIKTIQKRQETSLNTDKENNQSNRCSN
jgi:hypothetical protein